MESAGAEAYKWYTIFPSVAAAEAKVPLNGAVPVHFKALGLHLLLGRNSQGFYAAYDECPHKRIVLHKGYINEEAEMVCPLHGYRFSLRTGRNTSGEGCRDLALYPVRQEAEGALQIGIPWTQVPS